MAGAEASPDVATTEIKEEKPDVKLEDLFADMDSDDEFPSSGPQLTPTSSDEEEDSAPMFVVSTLLCLEDSTNSCQGNRYIP